MLARALGIALVATLTLSWAPGVAAQESQLHQVVISVNPDGTLSYSQDPVIADRGDRVVFSAPGATSWTVTFREGSPFANRVITGTGEQSRTVPVLPDAAYQSYFYDASVTIGDRTYEEDPEIIVRDRGMR